MVSEAQAKQYAENLLKAQAKRQEINAMVRFLKNESTYLSINGWKEGKKMKYYNDGVFIEGGEEHINNVLRKENDTTSSGDMVEAKKMLIAETPCDMKELDKEIMYIACNNGMINLMTGELEDFDPKYKATIRIPIKFDENTTPSLVDKFLSEIVRPEDVPLLEELAGYCLLRTSKYKAIFFLYGENDSAKSTFILLLEELLGKENCSSQKPQDLANPMLKFNKTQLYKKLMNTCAEVSTTPLKETGLLKELSAGDHITGEEKFGNFVDFYNYAKLVFASNHGIQFPETEEFEMMSRMKFIIFPNTFPQNPAFFSTISTPAELSRFLYLAVRGLRRLIDNKEFSNHKTKEENLEIYHNFGDSVMRFARNRIEKGVLGSWAFKHDIIAEFNKYCTENNLIPISEYNFWEKFKAAVGYTSEHKHQPKGVDGKQHAAVWGIQLLYEDKIREDTPKKEIKNQDPKKEDPHHEIKVIPTITDDHIPEDLNPDTRTPEDIEMDERIKQYEEELPKEDPETRTPQEIEYDEHMHELAWKEMFPEIEMKYTPNKERHSPDCDCPKCREVKT